MLRVCGSIAAVPGVFLGKNDIGAGARRVPSQIVASTPRRPPPAKVNPHIAPSTQPTVDSAARCLSISAATCF
jgi:hypothetical protein